MLRSTFGAFLPPLRPARAASDSAPAHACLRLKDLGAEAPEEKEGGELRDAPEIRSSHVMVSNRSCHGWKVEQSNCAVAVESGGESSSSFSAHRTMWQEAIRRKQYILNRTGEANEGNKRGGKEKRVRSRDWLYESYYCMSQQHPLIVFLLLIVMGACLALLTVFFASGLVSCPFTTRTHTHTYMQSADL